jgi:hypothetical protein
MKICVIVYLLIILFLFILIHPYIQPLLSIQEGMDDCIVNTLADLKIEVSELKKKIDAKDTDAKDTDENYEVPPDQEETGVFLKDNMDSI